MAEEDEKETLEIANKQLRTELEILKERVEHLREIRGVQEEGKFDEEALLLSLENDLLREQLLEQQRFLEGCKLLLAETIQTETSDFDSKTFEPTFSEVAKKDLMKQGAENALTHLFHLVSRSQYEGSWTSIKLPDHVFKTAVPGLNVTASYRKEPVPGDPKNFTFCLRVDGCYPNISPEIVTQGYWSTWISAESFATVFANFFDQERKELSHKKEVTIEKTDREEVVSGKTPVPFKLRDLMSCREDDGSEIRVNLYRELPDCDQPRDWVYVMTKLEREMAMSTLNLASELTPSVAARRDQHTRRVIHKSEKPRRKRARGTGSSSASQLLGKQKCLILARNSMRSVNATDMHDVNSMRVDPDTKLVEGLFCWQDHVNIDKEVDCAEGKEIRRERVPASRASAFISFTTDQFPVQDTALHELIVDASGKATEKYAKLIDMYYSIMTFGAGSGAG